MATHKISVSFDFAELARQTTWLIWRVNQLAAYALRAADKVGDEEFEPLTLPDALIQLAPAHEPDAMTRTTFRQWVIGCALRDSVESILLLLDGVRRVCAMSRFCAQGTFPAREWSANAAAQKKFEFYGLKRKVDTLNLEFGLELPKDYTADLLTLNAARNCLVHKLGIATDLGLSVTWLGFEMSISGTSGVKVVDVLPADFGMDDEIRLTARRRSRHFAPGEQIELSTGEFCEIGMFLQLYSQRVVAITQQMTGLVPSPKPSSG